MEHVELLVAFGGQVFAGIADIEDDVLVAVVVSGANLREVVDANGHGPSVRVVVGVGVVGGRVVVRVVVVARDSVYFVARHGDDHQGEVVTARFDEVDHLLVG